MTYSGRPMNKSACYQFPKRWYQFSIKREGGGGVESLEALGGTRAKNLDPMGARQATPSRCATCFYLIELRLNT